MTSIQNSSKTSRPAISTRPVRALVVDNSDVFRRTLSAFLESFPGLEGIGAAANASEALILARQHQPDLVLLDLQMPGINGLETMVRLRQLNPATRVIILTVWDDHEVRAECLARGADDFVSKTKMHAELPVAIRRLFSDRLPALERSAAIELKKNLSTDRELL